MEKGVITEKLGFVGRTLFEKYGSTEYELRTVVYDAKGIIERQYKEITTLKQQLSEANERVQELESISKMPLSLTAENGAKSLLNGEFYESIETMDENGNQIGIETVVQWTTIKDIYKKIVDHFTE